MTTQIIGPMFADIFPITAPRDTSMSQPPINRAGRNGDAPMRAMLGSIIESITDQGAPGEVPWEPEMNLDFSIMIGRDGMSYIDASEPGTTAEQLNDMIFEWPHMCSPWDDASEQQFEQYMPLFSLKVDPRNCSPGFVPLATPVLLNQLQAQLLKAERDARMTISIGGGKWRALMPLSDPGSRVALRTIGGTTPFDRVRFDAPRMLALNSAAQKLETLRFFAALTPDELNQKINYVGPITQIFEMNGPKGRSGSSNYTSGGRVNHRMINTSWHSRGKVHNMFATDPQPGDGLYFKIAPFSREQMAQVTIEQGVARNIGTKRPRADENAYVISPALSSRVEGSDSFVQIRGFSSREQRHYMGDSSNIDAMKPDAADRFYVEREHRAAMEWREYRFDDETGLMQLVDVLEQEGEQEVRDNTLPSIVLENYLSAGVVIPVGTVKDRLQRRITEQAIINAHYDHVALSALPHIDIQQNRCA